MDLELSCCDQRIIIIIILYSSQYLYLSILTGCMNSIPKHVLNAISNVLAHVPDHVLINATHVSMYVMVIIVSPHVHTTNTTTMVSVDHVTTLALVARDHAIQSLQMVARVVTRPLLVLTQRLKSVFTSMSNVPLVTIKNM